MRKKATILAGLLAMTSLSAQADSLIINGLSVHFGGGDFNELNYGMGFIHDVIPGTGLLGSDYVHGGGYYNSYRDVSTYAAVGYKVFRPAKDLTIGAELGIVTGYKLLPIAPMLVPVVQYKNLRALVMLPGCAACVGAVGFQLEVPFK